jgi:hypothetical protein
MLGGGLSALTSSSSSWLLSAEGVCSAKRRKQGASEERKRTGQKNGGGFQGSMRLVEFAAFYNPHMPGGRFGLLLCPPACAHPAAAATSTPRRRE